MVEEIEGVEKDLAGLRRGGLGSGGMGDVVGEVIEEGGGGEVELGGEGRDTGGEGVAGIDVLAVRMTADRAVWMQGHHDSRRAWGREGATGIEAVGGGVGRALFGVFCWGYGVFHRFFQSVVTDMWPIPREGACGGQRWEGLFFFSFGELVQGGEARPALGRRLKRLVSQRRSRAGLGAY